MTKTNRGLKTYISSRRILRTFPETN